MPTQERRYAQAVSLCAERRASREIAGTFKADNGRTGPDYGSRWKQVHRPWQKPEAKDNQRAVGSGITFQQRAANRFTPWWHKMFSRLPSAYLQKVVRMRNEYWNTQPNGQRQLHEMANSSMDRLYGVVYGIVFLPTRRIYVGQTITSLWRRFQEHLWHRFDAGNVEEWRMKRILRLAGKEWWKDFVPVPLEVIHYIKSGDRAVDLDRFRMQSLRREAFWINKYAAQGPAGLNTAFTPGSQATQQRRQRRKVGKIELGHRTQRHTFTGAPRATSVVEGGMEK